MNRLVKICATSVMAFFAFGNLQAQANKTLTIDSIAQLEPIIIGDTTDFLVQVRVTNLLALPDSVFGDLFYYYLTDSMMNAGDTARILMLGDGNENVIDPFIDTVHIDIRANEIRTTPVNLIVVWPAMISPEVLNTDSITTNASFAGYLGILPNATQLGGNIIYPCPAMQFIYIRSEEINLIRTIQILSMDGKALKTYNHSEFQNGFINIDDLATGTYLIELQYNNNHAVRTKILKH